LNEGQGIHSIYHPTQLNYSGPWQQVLVAPFFNKSPYELNNVNNMAIIGLAAGTTARQATFVYPNIEIDGFEIDPEIVEVGKEFFNMDTPNLNIFVQDGRWGLEKRNEEYQIISVDAYRPPYIPWHMTTKEFFNTAYDHLSYDGVLVINVGRAPNDRRLINSLSTTIQTTFPSIHVIDIPNSFNSIIFATKNITSFENFLENYNYISQLDNVNPLLLQAMSVTIMNQAETPSSSYMVFTDDKAPVEWITNTMVLNFILSDDMDKLQ